ncbi:iron uptake porin, partial [Microcoleus sp.]|uniref:iron uptake porin n=1 Tax=Microcoleus sp. TaxID=44472 RepID=UPI00403E7A0E
MSKFLWKGLLVSPAVLAASLVVSSTALAAEQPVEIAAAAQANLQLAGAATEPAKPETAKPETAEPVPLARNLTLETIEKESANLYEGFANEPIAPVAEQAKAPSNPVAVDLSETKPAVAPANLGAEEPVAKQIPAVAPANLSETQPAVAPANLNAEKAVAQSQQISQSSVPSTQPQAESSVLEQINEYSTEGSDSADAVGQVTSVSQLSDIRPTDWAFQALQSLVERYGCIAGYPDGTFRGNRAMTRYEFAAGLNACLDKVSQFIQGSRTRVMGEDLASMQRLQEEFAAELATLRGRVDVLEARASELEANQFSTTTKLNGEVIFGLTGIA